MSLARIVGTGMIAAALIGGCGHKAETPEPEMSWQMKKSTQGIPADSVQAYRPKTREYMGISVGDMFPKAYEEGFTPSVANAYHKDFDVFTAFQAFKQGIKPDVANAAMEKLGEYLAGRAVLNAPYLRLNISEAKNYKDDFTQETVYNMLKHGVLPGIANNLNERFNEIARPYSADHLFRALASGKKTADEINEYDSSLDPESIGELLEHGLEASVANSYAQVFRESFSAEDIKKLHESGVPPEYAIALKEVRPHGIIDLHKGGISKPVALKYLRLNAKYAPVRIGSADILKFEELGIPFSEIEAKAREEMIKLRVGGF